MNDEICIICNKDNSVDENIEGLKICNSFDYSYKKIIYKIDKICRDNLIKREINYTIIKDIDFSIKNRVCFKCKTEGNYVKNSKDFNSLWIFKINNDEILYCEKCCYIILNKEIENILNNTKGSK